MASSQFRGVFSCERAADLARCHVEYVSGKSSDAAQLGFMGDPGARFGSCCFILKDAPDLDYFMSLSAGSEALARIDSRAAELEERGMRGEPVPDYELPGPTMSEPEMNVVKEVFPFIAALVEEQIGSRDYSRLGLAIDKTRPLWEESQGDGRPPAKGFAVTIEDSAVKARLFAALRLVESRMPDQGCLRTPLASTSDVWHGRLANEAWELPDCVAATSEEARPGYHTQDGSEYVDRPATLHSKVRALADLLRHSQAVVVYTGAGVSTAAGLGDYASKAPGSHAPHKRSGVSGANRLELKPTFSHHSLAAMQQHGLVNHWLQQNHDRLAQKAGFPQERINEIHGAWGDDKNMVKMMDDTLRDDLVQWMGHWRDRADLCIAIGTTLCGMNADQVAKASAERHLASQPGQQGLVIINLQRTPMDASSNLRIWGLSDDVFRLLATDLRLKVPSNECKARGEEWQNKHPRCKYNTKQRSVRDPL